MLKGMNLTVIEPKDRELIEQLRKAIKAELELVPAYNDDYSLLRWIIGWDRKLEVIIPKIKFSLRSISALGLDKEDFSSIEKITAYCDAVSKPLQYLPGSLLGYDKDHNVVSMQMLGRLDARGLFSCLRNSDLYVLRIAESEGVMSLIRANEKRLGRQLGTIAIFDLEGLSLDMLWMPAVKVITSMLSQLQEMFPDVIRKIFIVNSPTFIQLVWTLFSPCLAKQTQQKIQFLGSDFREKLREHIGEDELYENWGGKRPAETPYGHIRTGGKVPKELRYDQSNDLPNESLQRLNIPARTVSFVPVVVEGEHNPNRRLSWWWRLESGDIGFGILRAADPNSEVAESPDDVTVRPKFKLQTDCVPEDGEVSCAIPGTYKLVFDNSYGKIWSKNVKYFVKITERK